MAKILINDGIHPTGLRMLQDAGHEVSTDKVEQGDLEQQLPQYDAICVRSATKVRESLINQCPNLKVIGRGGVGLDNIDVDFARGKGVKVINTPSASSRSVAELVFGHALSLSRFLHIANREMPTNGNSNFKALKKSYSKGVELKGKTLGVIGLGRIGCETAKIGLGMGMNVIGSDITGQNKELTLDIAGTSVPYTLDNLPLEAFLPKCDYITLHVPSIGKPILGAAEFDLMKDGAILINASRGGTVDEDAMLAALDSGKLVAAGLDVFEGEPSPRQDILNQPNVSLTPHIGASTGEAQENIGIELANQLIDILG